MTNTWAIAEKRGVGSGRGVMRYRDVGDGPVLVFVHGVLVNGDLWREVVDLLAGRFRCVVPDLPLGGHSLPLGPGADVGPREVAEMVADLMDELDLEDVTLVGNDTGGAICQVVISAWPERVGSLVLTNCDAYEYFFPPLLRAFEHGPRIFGGRFTGFFAWALRYRSVQRLLFWLVVRRRVEDAALDRYLGPLQEDAGVRRDLTGFLRQVSNRYTLDAAKAFSRFWRPVLIVWGEDDFLFPAHLARRLQEDFPHASLKFVAASRAFVPVDRPRRLAEEMEVFLGGGEDGIS